MARAEGQGPLDKDHQLRIISLDGLLIAVFILMDGGEAGLS